MWPVSPQKSLPGFTNLFGWKGGGQLYDLQLLLRCSVICVSKIHLIVHHLCSRSQQFMIYEIEFPSIWASS
ncbi:unnamed protein product [Schistosoma spindalis]|nr:unnamed protein product [Schistosoma spindale]